LECYSCHASWNINFLGFHFDRNESLTQLDLLSGKRTTGRVTTQEKIFATWKSFYAGFNEKGHVAPYLTGFSTMGTVRDKNGELLLDQQMPVTANGLSGMTMIHHQVHTTRSTARSCIECHRSSATWGLGSANFRLSRRLAFVADRRGVEVVALDRAQLSASRPLAKVVAPNIVALAVESEPLQGHARFVYAAERERGVHVLDVSDPTAPRRVGFAASVSPRALALCGDVLLCADGAGGLRLFDVSTPSKIRLLSVVPSLDARALTVQWPYAYVADGAGGWLIVDVRAPLAPLVAGGLALDWKGRGDESVAVGVLFQYSRPTVFADRPADDREEARLLCAVLDARRGLELVDVTEPGAAFKLWPARYAEEQPLRRLRTREGTVWRDLALRTQVDLGQAQGGTPTRERDLVYVLAQRDENGNAVSNIAVLDVTNPLDANFVSAGDIGAASTGLQMISVYQPPFLSRMALVAGSRGLLAGDLSISEQFKPLGAFAGLASSNAVACEEFAFDRSISEQGVQLKDVSHRDSRWLKLAEIQRVLAVSGESLAMPTRVIPTELPFATARLHLTRLDEDRSGFLEGAEFERGGGASADFDKDGRLSLMDLVNFAARSEGRELTSAGESQPMSPSGPGAGMNRRALSIEHAPDGELACLLDTIRPQQFDADNDSQLDPSEFSRALFFALDLNGDKQLDLAELSRLGGETRELRLGGARAKTIAAQYDKNGDGVIAIKEWRQGAEQFALLDFDQDGKLRLAQRGDPLKGKRPDAGPSEWPTRQPGLSSLPPVVTREIILAVFDSDGDGILSAKELKARPDILDESDDTRDGRVEINELKADLDRIDAFGVDVTLDGFLERWDLDRDGKVSASELSLWARK
jgi:Ca2+-binding EF-hand superfamily protein